MEAERRAARMLLLNIDRWLGGGGEPVSVLAKVLAVFRECYRVRHRCAVPSALRAAVDEQVLPGVDLLFGHICKLPGYPAELEHAGSLKAHVELQAFQSGRYGTGIGVWLYGGIFRHHLSDVPVVVHLLLVQFVHRRGLIGVSAVVAHLPARAGGRLHLRDEVDRRPVWDVRQRYRETDTDE